MGRPHKRFLVLILASVLGSPGFAQDPGAAPEGILIPGGEFLMGRADGPGNEAPTHRVTVSAFVMARTEVTVGQFRRFADATGYQTTAERNHNGLVVNLLAKELTPIFEYRPDASWRNPYYTQDEGFPVTLVSHSDAQHYCNWLSQQQGLSPVYAFGPDSRIDRGASGWRLPTEAEWEWAARSVSSGEEIRQERLAAPIVHGRPVSCLTSTEGSGRLSFLLGNVNEWCEDWYGAYGAGDQKNPTGPADSGVKVLRGGSWYQDFWYTEVLNPTTRWWADPEDPVSNDVGFRVVRNR